MSDSIVDQQFGNIDGDSFGKGMKADDAVILDVRTPMEYQTGHLQGAILLDYNNPSVFLEGLENLDKSKRYFVYCRSGVRSAAACAMMREREFQAAYNLIGGIISWKGPIEK
jgi:rhodanese-related sulfurtransferase